MTLLSERSLVFAQADAAMVSAYVNEHVGHHRIRLPVRDRPRASILHRSFSNLDLCRLSYGGQVQVTSPALESVFHLQVLLQGRCLARGAGRERVYAPGQMLLINPDEPVDLTYSEDCEKFILTLPVRVLETACLTQGCPLPATGVRFEHQAGDAVAVGNFLALLELLCLEAEEVATPATSALYERLVASKLLALVENSTWAVPTVFTAGSRRFEVLQAFIDEHLGEDISVERLMQVANVSRRTLYSLFERHVGVAPGDYIRQRKLEQVRQRLLDPRACSVTAVALDLGFVHLGRFAELYRKRFGERPSVTWKRGREEGAQGG
ncbi:AraC family transcriptional regulator [Pseudomonas oryzihabitans]|uniref:AraC family transcriptional regulator n=1 Tax=Pseudomonas oryzihabitans TaxID=47885 RepID=UPI0028961CFC|nr:AraC family transcriptional regulator [Pseudomonas oryzihabitans]MDT3722218.1 AraC family transcriptional regulator [Pseudomonas oryzihabitans]